MTRKSEILFEELDAEFDSSSLLVAVERLDKVRHAVGDRVNLEPPPIRQHLMKLHKMVMDVSNGSAEYSIEDISDYLSSIEMTLFTVQEEIEKMGHVLRGLNNVLNQAWNRMEELEE